jgi:hypothetical protein
MFDMDMNRSMPADTEPVQHIRHELLKAGVLHARDTFRALEIGRGLVAALLPLAGIVDQELRHLAQRAAFLAVIGDHADAAILRFAHAFLDAVHQIGPAGADVGAEHVRAVALVMNAAGDAAAADRRDPPDRP